MISLVTDLAAEDLVLPDDQVYVDCWSVFRLFKHHPWAIFLVEVGLEDKLNGLVQFFYTSNAVYTFRSGAMRVLDDL